MEKIPSSEILNKQVRVTVLNKEGNEIKVFNMRGGMNLWVFIRKQGLPIGSACSGVGVCAACDIYVTELSPNSISAKNEFETETLKRNKKPENSRLACLCRVYEDIEIRADYW